MSAINGHAAIDMVPAEQMEGYAPVQNFAFARAGDVVFLECSQDLSSETLARLTEQLKAAVDGSGVRVVILSRGIKVARVGDK